MVTLGPAAASHRYKYTYMEEMLGNFKLARQVFQRWMKWEPDENAFGAFAKFEMRRGDEDAARAVYEQCVLPPPPFTSFPTFSSSPHPMCNLFI
jgi:crooked neck